MIEVAPYSSLWPSMFAEEASRIREEFGATALRVSHVGSTSVPGLDAKPVIDIQVSVASLGQRDSLDEHMRRLGYTHMDVVRSMRSIPSSRGQQPGRVPITYTFAPQVLLRSDSISLSGTICARIRKPARSTSPS